MTSQLTVTKQLTTDHWYVTATIASGQTLPQEIFLYTNTGNLTLGEYSGVVTFEDFSRIQIYDGITIFPVFGNKYLRYSQAKINVYFDKNVDTVITNLIASIQTLSTAYQANSSSTTIYNII
jgi:hypothetical protein